MTAEQHKARHRELDGALDELVADYIKWHPGADLRELRVIEVMAWGFQQCVIPSSDGPDTVHVIPICAHCGELLAGAGPHPCGTETRAR